MQDCQNAPVSVRMLHKIEKAQVLKYTPITLSVPHLPRY